VSASSHMLLPAFLLLCSQHWWLCPDAQQQWPFGYQMR
jgi:hypothetical protein